MAKGNDVMEGFFSAQADSWDDNEKSSHDELREFLKVLPIQKGMRVLDLGCGTGIITGILHDMSSTQVTGMDLSKGMVDKAVGKYPIETACFLNEDFYSYSGGKFDFIVVFNAYPHFMDVPSFALKAEEALNPGGYLAILHNFSRARINKHHEGVPKGISRELMDVGSEAIPFSKGFDPITKIDDDSSFVLVLRRKAR